MGAVHSFTQVKINGCEKLENTVSLCVLSLAFFRHSFVRSLNELFQKLLLSNSLSFVIYNHLDYILFRLLSTF